MPRKKIIDELKKLLRQRGVITRQQLEYAMIEEQGIKEMYSVTRPSEEVRFSHLRTLESYIGENGVRIISHGRGKTGFTR